MTIATVERLMGLRRGWRVRMVQPAQDIMLVGTVSEADENKFRIGVDADAKFRPGQSIEFEIDKVVHDHWDVEVTDRSGELEAEVVDQIPDADRSILESLTHDDPDAAGLAVVERPDGYDQHDTEVALSLAGARQDDAALADAERDTAEARMQRLIVTIHLPLPVSKVGHLLATIGTQFESAVWKQSPDEQEMRIYAYEEET